MAEAYERWSEEQDSRDALNTATAQRVFDVILATNAADCYGATLVKSAYTITTGLVPVLNEEHPTDTRKKVNGRRISRPALNIWRIAIYYAIPVNGTEHPGEEDDPLSQPTRFRWSRSKTSEQVDRDKDGNPIVNSNLDAFANGAVRTFTQRILEAIRYEASYDASIADLYEDKVNSSTLTISGIGSWPAGTVKCNTYAPTGEYIAAADYIETAVQLEIRPDGWATRQLDQGTKGRDASGVFLPLYSTDGQVITSPVRLDGKGNPMDIDSHKLGNPTGNIAGASATDSPTGSTLETTADANFLRYKVYDEIDLNGLGL